ncbi:MAG: DNRLRE domain-containing protein, partial [Planctomycetota bacterium]
MTIGFRRRPLRGLRLALSIAGGLMCSVCPAIADTVELVAARDNTLYESATGALSNGAGTSIFVGATASGAVRRGLVWFDVAAEIPAGSTINAVTLQMRVTQTVAGAETVALHRVTQDWGEGASNADAAGGGGGGGGAGAPAASGDATWLH